MRLPLSEALNKKANHLSYHTPAHNGGIVIDTRLDVTELSYSDNLLQAEGVILESMREVAKAYGVENVLYSTAGATTLIHTVIRALRQKGAFLIYGEAHKSVYNAFRINNIKGYLCRDLDLKQALLQTGAKVVVCTSPNYFGRVLNLNEIRSICDTMGAILVVDASHGSHFAFSSLLPNSATKYADIVIHSQHKTMQTLTGGASLCYTHEHKEALIRAFKEIHTTSPNYLIMSSIESATKLLVDSGERIYSDVIKEVELFSSKCLGQVFSVVPTDDKTRLVIKTPNNAHEVADYLERTNIYPEMVYGDKLVFIVTPFNYIYLDTLYDALCGYNFKCNYQERNVPVGSGLIELQFGDEYEKVSLDDAVGRVSYGEVGLYPPGVPIVAPGERITKEQVQFLKANLNFTFGLEKSYALVLK